MQSMFLFILTSFSPLNGRLHYVLSRYIYLYIIDHMYKSSFIKISEAISTHTAVMSRTATEWTYLSTLHLNGLH